MDIYLRIMNQDFPMDILLRKSEPEKMVEFPWKKCWEKSLGILKILKFENFSKSRISEPL